MDWEPTGLKTIDDTGLLHLGYSKAQILTPSCLGPGSRKTSLNLQSSSLILKFLTLKRLLVLLVQTRWTFTFAFSSVQSFSHVWLFATPWTTAHRPPCPSPAPGLHPNPCPLSRWCHPTISSSVIPFSCLQSFPASGSFQISQLFTSGGQSIGASASTSVLPVNTQDWSPLGWTGWILLQSKGHSRVFSNTTVEKHQFFSAQLSLWSNSDIIHDHWRNHSLD